MNNIVNPEIQGYAESFTSPENELLTELRELTFSDRKDSNMLSGLYQGRVLSMISKLVAPKYVLEIGTYMGYSALCLAEGLVDAGRVVTLDVDEKTNAIANSYWDRSEFAGRIDGHLGNALEFIPGIEESVDLVFIDADKENYSNYYDLVLPKMRKGGLIVADNVLWSGDVLNVENGTSTKTSSKALHQYNQKIMADAAVENVLFAIRDGLMIARKL